MQKQKVFVWENYKSWRSVVLSILSEFVDADVFTALRAAPPRYVSSEDLSWLDDVVEAVKGVRPDTKALLSQELPKRYCFLRAYHACRPVSLTPYYQNGLLPADSLELQRIAREIFQDKAGLEKAIVKMAEEAAENHESPDHGTTWLCLTKDELTEFSGHYLLQGSEYLAGLAVRIHETPVLRARGKATLFGCDVPMDYLDEGTISELAGAILERIGDTALRRPSGSAGNMFGFSITVPLQPEFIVSTEHPTGIPNPHNYGFRED